MSSLLKPALIMVLKRLPIVISIIENNQLTTPVAIDETIANVNGEPTVQMVTGAIDLYGLMKEQYPQELSLFTAIQGHCTKTIYLMTEGELRIFLTEKEAVAMKRISDTLRDAGVSIAVREKLLDLLAADDNEFEWLSTDDEADVPLVDVEQLTIPIPANWTPSGANYGLANKPATITEPPKISDSSKSILDTIKASGAQLSTAEQTVVNKITATGITSLVGVERIVLNALLARIGASGSTTVTPTSVVSSTEEWTPAGASFGQVHTPVQPTASSSDSVGGYNNKQMLEVFNSNPTFPLTHVEQISVDRLRSNPSRSWSAGEYLFMVSIVNKILGK